MSRLDFRVLDRRDALDEIARAIATARRVYARQVSQGALAADEAARRVRVLEAVAGALAEPWDVWADLARHLKRAGAAVIKIGARWADGVEVQAAIHERPSDGETAAEALASLRAAYAEARAMKKNWSQK